LFDDGDQQGLKYLKMNWILFSLFRFYVDDLDPFFIWNYVFRFLQIILNIILII